MEPPPNDPILRSPSTDGRNGRNGHDGSVNRDVDHDGDTDFRDAAILAELDTGKKEETVSQAWHHVLVRLGRMALGFILVFAGLAMMVLPGPGLVALAAGLVILAQDFVWADRALRYVRSKAPGMDEEGPIPRSTIIVSVMLMAAAGLTALWWFNGGSDSARGWIDTALGWF